MTSLEVWRRVGAVGSVACLGALLGCVGDEAQDDAEENEPSLALAALLPAVAPRWTESSGDDSSNESSSRPVGRAQQAQSGWDCSICAAANACCHAVSSGGNCSFSTATCSALDPQRQSHYVGACVTSLRTTIDAWQVSGRTAPSPCRF